MKFEIDKQTLSELELFSQGSNSIYKLFKQTKTEKGELTLYSMMHQPSTDISFLKKRTETIRFFMQKEISLNFHNFEYIEHYLKYDAEPGKINAVNYYLYHKFFNKQGESHIYLLTMGLEAIKSIFQELSELKQYFLEENLPDFLKELFEELDFFAQKEKFQKYLFKNRKWSVQILSSLDFQIRENYKAEFTRFLQKIYLLDAYISIAKVANEKKFVLPEFIEAESQVFEISDLKHPLIPEAVPNDADMKNLENMCFLTGPNMAGKSTYLKSIGIAMYLAHIGFPVAAKQMKTSVYNGMMTTINLSDNLQQGYSHFYAEVKRLKEVALQIKEKDKMFVIFDELFRGTNVKDAYDASLMILNAFSKIKSSTFYISTHITEISEEIKDNPNILFLYMNSEWKEEEPFYDYKVKEGISHERLGLYIVQKENIVEILEEKTSSV
ncbi:MutS-related protein [Aureivirga sp. CE67]|uniref:MutS-related protein n=1 Tax=Aureivirga sp. CE67 TaxID=1788983 RepID=UPI0018CBBE30|nr:hypothetical protein [Aureivirga sp. CE67]